MIRSAAFVLGLAAATCFVPAIAGAQEAPPTYKADPSVYKVIFEDQNFRVIQATWKAGQTDKEHSHPVPSIVYGLDNCLIRITSADGKTRDVKNKPGEVAAVPITPSHHAQNIGHHTCRLILVERK
jgi:quercetin dioxygenase-like cupin family protein